MKFLKPFDEPIFAAMRVVLAFLYMMHGWQKAFGIFGGHMYPITTQLGVAGWLETILGPLIGVGWFTSWAAFVASGEMAFGTSSATTRAVRCRRTTAATSRSRSASRFSTSPSAAAAR